MNEFDFNAAFGEDLPAWEEPVESTAPCEAALVAAIERHAAECVAADHDDVESELESARQTARIAHETGLRVTCEGVRAEEAVHDSVGLDKEGWMTVRLRGDVARQVCTLLVNGIKQMEHVSFMLRAMGVAAEMMPDVADTSQLDAVLEDHLDERLDELQIPDDATLSEKVDAIASLVEAKLARIKAVGHAMAMVGVGIVEEVNAE